MQTKRLILLAISVVAALTAGYFAGHRSQDQDLRAGVVRAYNVPVEQAEKVKGSINALLNLKDGEAYGRAQVFDNGLMLVVAPNGYHQGIKEMVHSLSQQKPQPRSAIRLDYWLVLAQDNAASNEKSFGELAPVLTTINKLDGAKKFRVLEHLSNNTSMNEETRIEGAVAKITSTPFLANSTINLKLDFNSPLGNLKSNTQLASGEFYVLGQNAVQPGRHVGSENLGSAPGDVYYIIRATTVK